MVSESFVVSYGKEALTHGNVVQTVKVRQGLNVSFVFNQLLCASVQKADVLWKKINHLLWTTWDKHVLDQPGGSPLH